MKTVIKQIMNFIHELGIYGVAFLAIIGIFSTLSAKNVFNFWLNDEISNNEWGIDVGSKIESDYISNFFGAMEFVNINGFIRNTIGQHQMNDVVKLNNGYLLMPQEYESDEALEEKATKLDDLHQYLDTLNIPMLFAVTPYTCSKYDSQLPAGVGDFGNSNIDRFLGYVEAYGVETLDFRKVMYEDGIDQYGMYYKTDHHWTTQAGFYAAGKLSDWIQKKTGADINTQILDISNYTLTTYSKCFLGSNGQRTGRIFGGIDDFTLLTPDFPTSISSEIQTGTFEELLIDDDVLQSNPYAQYYIYDNVMGNSLGNYVNNNSLNDTKLLIIADSYIKSTNPYLILGYKEVRTVNNNLSYQVTKEMIEEYQPDVVILMYYPDHLCGDNRSFSFQVD